MFIFSLQNLNNRDTSIVQKRNKLNDKHDNQRKKNDIFLNNKATNINKNNQMNNGTPKNDTYESVCSPEDVAERNKLAQRHAIISSTNGNNHNHSAVNHGSVSQTNTINNNNASAALNNGRLLKRVVSAPVPINDNRGKLKKKTLIY